MRVAEVTSADFDLVFQLLQKLNSSGISKESWKACFDNPFSAEDHHAGYALWDKDELVGFFGTLFSDRVIRGKVYRFCNTHSWIVLPEYRMKGLLLLNRIHKQKGYILTNFSASEGPYAIMKQLGWKEKNNKQGIIWRDFLTVLKKRTEGQCISNDFALDIMNEHQKSIFFSHQPYKCQMNVVKMRDEHTFQVFKEIPYSPSILRKIKLDKLLKLKLGQLYYTSDPEIFFKRFKENMSTICQKYGWVGMILPDQFIRQYGLRVNRKYMRQRPVLYRTVMDFDPQDLDLLYSEIFVLDLI